MKNWFGKHPHAIINVLVIIAFMLILYGANFVPRRYEGFVFFYPLLFIYGSGAAEITSALLCGVFVWNNVRLTPARRILLTGIATFVLFPFILGVGCLLSASGSGYSDTRLTPAFNSVIFNHQTYYLAWSGSFYFVYQCDETGLFCRRRRDICHMDSRCAFRFNDSPFESHFTVQNGFLYAQIGRQFFPILPPGERQISP